MANPAFIFMNPTVTIGPDPADTGTPPALTVTCDLMRAEITNNVNMVDTGTLCGPAQLPGKIEFILDLEGYQSWEVDALFDYLWTHMRATVPFTLLPKNEPTGPTNPTFNGDCVCVPGQVGGVRETAAVFTASLPIVGIPTKTTTLARETSSPMASATAL
jgi:hypothetical protein